ncbi:MAG TPA: putative toxin-antitoxin system toxin component, PIN family [Thermoanaerobaculia bacterium]|nr:putative toxin-antitoxin system toxin component, PIN family [Thermoanaerobaculia bacterium]
MRAVFDTNVVIAGLVARGLCHEILAVHIPLHRPILSRPLWDELTDKLREKFELEPAELPLLALYSGHAAWVEAPPLPERVCRDADDDWVLATALAGEAEVVVTGDPDLLDLQSHQGIRILTPRQWLEGG